MLGTSMTENTEPTAKVKLTHDQAIRAALLIMDIIELADEGGPGAVQVNLHPLVVQEMRDLVREIRGND